MQEYLSGIEVLVGAIRVLQITMLVEVYAFFVAFTENRLAVFYMKGKQHESTLR